MHSINLNEEFGANADMLTTVLSDKGLYFKTKTDYYKIKPLLKKCLDCYVPDLIQACINQGLSFVEFKDEKFLYSVVGACSPFLLDELYEVMERAIKPKVDITGSVIYAAFAHGHKWGFKTKQKS